MKVISYTRFSSKRQAKGDSYRRQTDMSAKWCQENGYELDTMLRYEDLGVSAWSGANTEIGAFSTLLKYAKSGKIPPGSILIIEALDRLTRQSLRAAVPLFIEILNTGLTVVTLVDGKRWTADSLDDMADFMLSVLLLSRGFEESERKSGRLREKNEQARREQLREPFGSAPGWLVRESKSAPWTIDEAKAESVRKVFALAVAGHGSPEIAKRANAEKWPVPTRLGGNKEIWHVRMPGYLLRNRAVIGEHEYRIRTHEAHKASWHGQSTGITVPDYYPRIVSDEVWTLAQAAVDSRRTPMRRDDNYFNIFSGVMYCGSCGATMQRKIEFRGTSKGQIVCSNHQAGATECSPSSVKYVDTVLIREISRNAGVQMGVYEEMQEDFAAKLDGEKAKLSRLDAAAERIAETIIEVGDALPVLNRKARELAEERKQCLLEIDRLTRELADAKMDNLDKGFTEKVVPALYERSDEAKAIRADCNARFRRALDAIWIWPYDVAVVKYKHENTLHAISLPAKKGDRPGPFMMQAMNNELQLPDFVNLKKEARFTAISMDGYNVYVDNIYDVLMNKQGYSE